MTIASHINGRTRALGPENDPAWWRESAACRHADPELFFPISSIGRGAAEAQQAKAVCARCPVRQPCLDFALATGQEFGIWGGYDERELRLLQREKGAAETGQWPGARQATQL